MDLIIEIKDILLYNLGYNRYIIYREDWLTNIKSTPLDTWILLLDNLLKVIAVGKIKINVVIGGKELILEIYNIAFVFRAITSLLSED